ncbi:hypothetical protein [Natrialba swarupiae]|uniref:Uncharacterized protein n=1 Tax=Natrialba swarupiae TaxID=2448032 RepID=A0A5D5AKC1_9EURY|nr:hypothetical protein [Natrialba swarupiae]TYT62136.1 hypothetical protein FYC77_09255 [Natrialba swarupiae]
MAPAIVHFLVGASLAVLLAVPLALRTGAERRSLWLVGVGGLWGLFPDVHYVSPVFETQLRTLHESWVADLFAFHYTLDQPPFATNPLESIAGSILVFLVSVTVFTTGTAVSDPHGRNRSDPPTRHSIALRLLVSGYAVVVAAGLAAATVAVVLAATGRLEPVATLVGREGGRTALALVLAVALAGGATFALVVSAVGGFTRRATPLGGAVLGVLLGLCAWVVAAFAAPIWMDTALGLERPIPYVHRVGMVAIVCFGGLVGALYPAVRRLVAPPGYGSSR